MELRPYQIEAVKQLRAAYLAGKRAPLLVMPTGSGKTICFAHICQGAAARGNRVLILCHRRELIRQASDKLQALDVPHGLCMPGHLVTPRHQIAVASVQSLVRRLPQLGEFQLIIIDEAHHARAGSYETILAAHPRAKLLGVTATPCRLSGEGLGVHAGGFFDAMVEGPPMAELVAQGYLSPLIIYAPPLSTPETKLRKRAGEFVAEDDAALMDRPTITGDAIGHYRRYADGLQAIAFCCTVQHAKNVAQAFAAAGIAAESIDGSLKTFERDAILKRFASGQTRVLTSCELVSEGFDAPEAACAIMLRHTDSLTVYRQQVGRICRPGEGKTAILLDHVGNTSRHGLPDEPMNWSLDGKIKREAPDTAGVDIWQCPNCFCVCRAELQKCPQCGTERQHEKRKPPRVVAGELTMLQRPWERAHMSYQDYVSTVLNREQRKMQEDRAWAEQVANRRGYRPGWIEIIVRERHKTRMNAAMSGESKLFSHG